jgi:hypothetical protein
MAIPSLASDAGGRRGEAGAKSAAVFVRVYRSWYHRHHEAPGLAANRISCSALSTRRYDITRLRFSAAREGNHTLSIVA